MKKFKYTLIIVLASALALAGCRPNLYDVHYRPSGDEGELTPTAFKKGFNLSGTFEVGYPENGTGNGDASNIWMGHIDDATFKFISELGCDVVRVPMQLGQFIKSVNDYTLTDEFWKKLDILLDLGEKYNITVIIDNHQWGYCQRWAADHAMGFMTSIWTQIPEHCKNRRNVVYELLNEPDGEYWREHWGEVEVELLKVIRKVDTIHDVIVGPAPYHSLSELPVFEDEHLIYTNHFYEPFVFTHQGATWSGLGDVSLHFPYDPLQDNLSTPVPAGSQEEMANYAFRGTEDYICSKLDGDIFEVARRKGRFFVGEFGCELITVDQQSRANWHECVRKHLEEAGASWTLWSFALDFGIFKNTTSAVVNYDKDLNVPLARALGLTIPPSYQDQGGDESDFITLVLYDDDWGNEIVPVDTEGKDYLTIPCYDNPAPNSENCIRWEVGGAWQNYLVYRFQNLCRDLNQFDIENSFLRFKMRCKMAHPQQFTFGIWFLNNKNEFDMPAAQHNWVKYYWVSAADFTADGQWHNVSIPIKYFDFRNAEDAEVSSKDYFDWSKIMEIEFCSFDNENIAGEEIFLDDVVITGPKNEGWEPAPEPENSLVIFDDEPAAGWELSGTSGKYSISSDYASSGTKSLKWEANPNTNWGSCVSLSKVIDASECVAITFKAKFVNSTLKANDVLRIQLASVESQKFAECNMSAQDESVKDWVTYKIPVSSFATGTLDWATLKTINFYTPGWGSQGTATIYIDELTLVGVSGGEPGPGPGPEPEPKEGITVFADAMAEGWTLGGTDGKYMITDKKAATGSKSILWTVDANTNWGRILSMTSSSEVDMTECEGLSFNVMFEKSTFSHEAAWVVARVQMADSQGHWTEANFYAPEYTDWTAVQIYKSDFSGGNGIDWSKITSFCFYTPGWNAGTAEVYFDDVTLFK